MRWLWIALGHVSAQGRRKAGGHWERWCHRSGEFDGYECHWERVETCHLLDPRHVRHAPYCGLVRCEQWGGPWGNNEIAAGE